MLHRLLLVTALLLSPVAAVNAGFNWDRVPLFAHLGKWEGPFTDEEARFLAERFPYIMLEKTMEYRVPGVSAEEGILRAARQLKDINPDALVFYYWNAFIAYEMYDAVGTFLENEEEWAVRTMEGEIFRRSGGRACYNLAIPELREWWVDSVAEIIREHSDVIDGVFIDALPAASHGVMAHVWGEETAQGVHDGLNQMLPMVHEAIGDKTIMVYNGAGARLRRWEDRGLRHLEWMDGVMFEHLAGCSAREIDDGSLKPGWLEEDIELIRRAAATGKKVFVKGWPRSKPCLNRPGITNEAVMREEIVFPLAAFLIAAEENCYFLYNWGYTNHDGQYIWYDEYDKALGEPLGPAERDGSVFTRQFKHASVWLDAANEKARILWHDPDTPCGEE